MDAETMMENCPKCGNRYNPRDYDQNAPSWSCSVCKAPLKKTQIPAPQKNNSGKGTSPETRSGLAVASLVFGIVGLLLTPFSIVAVILGHVARTRIRKSGGTRPGKGLALAGLVIGYITIVVASAIFVTLLTVLPKAQSKAKQVKCFVTVKQLELALNSFQNDYGNLPIVKNQSGNEQDPSIILAILSARKDSEVARAFNQKGIWYFGVPESEKDGRDPWGNPIHIIFDSDYDNTITVGNDTIHALVAIWSNGPNGQNENGQGDDIASWKESPTRR